jgi:hypothetical protein
VRASIGRRRHDPRVPLVDLGGGFSFVRM